MTTIQIASDLHVEYNNDNIPDPLDFITPSADILILAGDIGSFYKIDQLTKFLEKLCSYFQLVLYVPGNHEWYMIPEHNPLSWFALEQRMKQIKDYVPNLYILDCSSVRIGNICIAGATLWSKPFNQIPPFIVRVNGMKTKEYYEKHISNLNYLKKMIKYCNEHKHKLLIVTHHPPTLKVLEGTKKRKKFIDLYATDLEYLLDKNNVHTWICGHIHKNFDFYTEKGCRIVSNQKGKDKDRVLDYRKNFTITL
jgi:Icc-related predicted phosphoesterase